MVDPLFSSPSSFSRAVALRITQDEYDDKLKSYKERQAELLEEIGKHDEADEEFYLTANLVANLATNAEEIFKSSEPLEKRQLLSFLLQNCELDGKNLLYELRSPFDDLIQVADVANGSRGRTIFPAAAGALCSLQIGTHIYI